MASSYIQNTKNNSIYYYIKEINQPLYQVIKNSGAKNYFMKSNITFLMPTNKNLLDQILSASPKESLNLLKQLLLNNTINNLSDFTRNIYNIYGFRLNNPSSLLIKIDPHWTQNQFCSVFLYDGKTVPESSQVTQTKQKNIKNKNSTDYKLIKHKEVLEKYQKYADNNYQGNNPFVVEIANILNIIKNNKQQYFQVCELIDNNAIVTWFLIMQLGLDDEPILSNDLFKLKTIDHPHPYAEYNEAFEQVKSTVNGQNWFKTVSTLRKKLVHHFDISLPEQIIQAYNNNYTKLLQDEIRFKYRNSSDYHWTDIVNDLNLIDWNYPQNHIIFANEELCQYLIQDEDKFYSGPVKFVKSIYFMYKPLNKRFYSQLVEKTKKSCDNPYENGIVYGDEGDRKINSSSPKEDRRGYNVQSVWNSLNELEREQIREFSHISKTHNKEDIKQLWSELSDEQKDYIKELSSQ